MPLTRKSILIVDDESAMRSLLTEILSPVYQCESVETAGEAVAVIEERRFEVALVDIGLPGMSGLSLCSYIANRRPETAVIIISGSTDEQSVADAMNAGARDFITKPFNLSDVLDTVEHALRHNSPGAAA
jgi:DNA-binding NtrC family response regulator